MDLHRLIWGLLDPRSNYQEDWGKTKKVAPRWTGADRAIWVLWMMLVNLGASVVWQLNERPASGLAFATYIAIVATLAHLLFDSARVARGRNQTASGTAGSIPRRLGAERAVGAVLPRPVKGVAGVWGTRLTMRHVRNAVLWFALFLIALPHLERGWNVLMKPFRAPVKVRSVPTYR